MRLHIKHILCIPMLLLICHAHLPQHLGRAIRLPCTPPPSGRTNCAGLAAVRPHGAVATERAAGHDAVMMPWWPSPGYVLLPGAARSIKAALGRYRVALTDAIVGRSGKLNWCHAQMVTTPPNADARQLSHRHRAAATVRYACNSVVRNMCAVQCSGAQTQCMPASCSWHPTLQARRSAHAQAPRPAAPAK